MQNTIRLLAALAISVALNAAPPSSPAHAAGDSEPSPPPKSDGKSSPKKKSSKQSETQFRDGYREAYATVYDRKDYTAGIAQLKALGRDDNASVATLIGYSYRKLGDYRLSQDWYERALKADPKHVKTWQYYGLWQVEQGRRDRAQYHLERIAKLCGTNCEEYKSLADALNATKAGAGGY
jgi:tetratricopeptide (TPR) repeat protein